MKKSNNTLPSILTANIFFLTIMMLLVIMGYILKVTDFNNFYFSVISVEYGLYLIPVLLYLGLKGYNVKQVLKLNKLSFKQILIISLIALCVVFIATFLNYVMFYILSLFGDFTIISQNIPIASSSSQLIIIILVTALTPAMCEETLFRGLIMSCYEQLGFKKAIIVSGLFFGIFHVNIQGLLGLSFMGIILAYLVFKTNSIFASMLAHLIYNSFGAISEYITSFSNENTIQIITTKNIMPVIFPSALIALPAVILCFILLKCLPKSKTDFIHVHTHYKNEDYIQGNIIKYIPLLPILLLYIHFSLKIFP